MAAEKGDVPMFDSLEKVFHRPEPFEFYTVSELWNDPHTSEQMLRYHLDISVDVSSRKAEFIDRSVEWIRSFFHVSQGFRIADFGCGPGLYAERLAELGASVTGIDLSERSIAHARNEAERSGLNIEYVQGNYLEYSADREFDLIIMIMCDLCALSPSQRGMMLKKFNSILAPGGSVLLDVYSLAAFDSMEEGSVCSCNLLEGFWSAEKYFGFRNTFKYSEEKVILDKYTIVERNRTRTVYNWLQYFSPEALDREFRDAGFTNVKLFGDVAGAGFDSEGSEFAAVAGVDRIKTREDS